MNKGRILFIIFLLSLFTFPCLIFAQESLPTTYTLESLVAKWVDLRSEIAEEKGTWKEQKIQLKQERLLLLKEKTLLEEEITQTKAEQTSAEAEQAKLLQDKKTFQKRLDQSLPAITRAEANLKRWQALIPPGLSFPLKKSFDQLPNVSGKSLSQRLQIILGLYGEIERLQHNVHLVKEMLKTDFGMQELEVIYLGLAQGFAVSKDNLKAGIGRPAKEGWIWDWRDNLAPEIRKAMDYYNHEKIADFVHLPLKIEEVKGE